MKIRKILLTLLAFTMALCIFAACGEEKPAPDPAPQTTYTVTFRDGETDITSVTVNAGDALTAEQIPAEPAGHDGATFLGWFVGTTKVAAGYKPAASVVALASFETPAATYTVTVANGDYTVGGLETSYTAGQRVIFTITPTDDTKEVDRVTSEQVTVGKSSAGNYFFDMPAQNVTIAVTLKDKEIDEPIDQVDERIELFLFGDLYKGARRSVYAKLHDGLLGEFTFESLNPGIVAVSETANIGQGDDMPEAFLWAKTAGTATIRCTYNADSSVYNEIEITVLDPANGESMPAELYGTLEGSIKLTSTEQLLDYDTAYEATASKTNDIVTIFEENDSTEISINANGDMANLSDAYQIELKDHTSGAVEFSKKFVTDQRNVCAEYIKPDNTVGKRAVFKEDADGDTDTIRWASSAYTNIFHARPSYSSPDLWKSFDGGKTYHYVGSDVTAPYICAFLYQVDISPDDMYFEVEGGKITKFTVVIDPAGYQNSQKFGRKIETTFSEIGTAKIDHVKPFEHEEYHTAIETARAKMAALKNYKAVMTFDGKTYEITYLEDTIDVVIKSGEQIISHTGAHKYGDGEGNGKTYYEYTYDDATKALTKGDEHDTPWEGEGADGKNVVRYPTFNFASEIFGQTAQDKTFISRINNGEFIKETCYLSVISDAYGIWDFSTDGTLKLDSSGEYIQEVSATVTILGEKSTLSIVFSAYNAATVDIQFTEAVTPAEPTTWEEGLSKVQYNLSQTLYDRAVELNIPLVQLPYVDPSVGFDAIERINRGGGRPQLENAIKIVTEAFDTTTDRDAYIALYKAALEAAGWTATGTKEEVSTLDLYQKDGVDFKIGIGWTGYYGAAQRQVQIGVFECTTLNLGD